MSLKIAVRDNPDRAVWEIVPEGEIDISTAQDFREAIENAIAEKIQDIDIDASKLSYIDSIGLGMIMRAYRLVRPEGRCVRVLNPRGNVKKLLSISGLDKILCH